MKHHVKLNSEQQQAVEQQAHQVQKSGPREFASAEELLRYDAAHTVVPPEIAQRLQKSTGGSPGSGPSWWKRLLGGNHP